MSESSASGAKSDRPVFVVDSWVVLEWLYGTEPARTHFRSRLEAAELGEIRLLLNRMNLGEITYSLIRKLGADRAEQLRTGILLLPIEIISVDDEMVDQAANLKSKYPVSYADCFAAVLAKRQKAPVITGDQDFQILAADAEVQVDWAGA